jgi:protein-tyrosine-phosphatase
MLTLNRRAFIAAFGAALSMPAAGRPLSTDAPRILFVCQLGSVKSAIARELLKRRAAERQVALTVTSRGITPEAHLPAAIRSRLLLDHLDPEAQPLRKLSQADLDAADKVIIFDKLPAELRTAKAEDWTDLPSIVNDYPKARAALDRRIEHLLTQVQRR